MKYENEKIVFEKDAELKEDAEITDGFSELGNFNNTMLVAQHGGCTVMEARKMEYTAAHLIMRHASLLHNQRLRNKPKANK